MQGLDPFTRQCTYSTPCGWCAKWDKKCDKKIGCGEDKPQRGLRAKAGIYDEAISESDAQEIIETIKSGKLPPIGSASDFGLQTLN
jgi:hypothetical protein